MYIIFDTETTGVPKNWNAPYIDTYNWPRCIHIAWQLHDETGCEFHRLGVETPLNKMPVLDTCTEKRAKLCKIPGGRGGRFKLPTLTELHSFLFQQPFAEAHNAAAEVEATARYFFELLRTGNYLGTELDATDDYLRNFYFKKKREL